MKIAEPNLLTLDYWRDEVSYQGITLPSGTIGCAALNTPDDVIDRLKQISLPLLAAGLWLMFRARSSADKA